MMKFAMPVSPYPTFPRKREKGQTKKAISALNEAGADYIPSTGLLADGYRI